MLEHHQGVESGKEVFLQVIYPEALSSPIEFYTYRTSSGWQEIGFEISDNSNRVRLSLCDGGIGDLDEQGNGLITTYLALAHHQGIDKGDTQDGGGGKGGCFIEAIAR